MSLMADAPGETTWRPAAAIDDETPRAPEHRVGSDEMDARLTELADLTDSWDGYEAKPIDRRALAVAVAMIKSAVGTGMSNPEIFPVPNGGVQLEWSVGSMELELEIEPGGAAVVFVGDDEESGRRFDGELPRDAALFRQAVAALGSHHFERIAD